MNAEMVRGRVLLAMREADEKPGHAACPRQLLAFVMQNNERLAAVGADELLDLFGGQAHLLQDPGRAAVPGHKDR